MSNIPLCAEGSVCQIRIVGFNADRSNGSCPFSTDLAECFQCSDTHMCGSVCLYYLLEHVNAFSKFARTQCTSGKITNPWIFVIKHGEQQRLNVRTFQMRHCRPSRGPHPRGFVLKRLGQRVD